MRGPVAYIVFTVVQSRRESQAVQDEYAGEFGTKEEGKPGLRRILLYLGMIAGGLVVLVLGARWLVNSATAARALGMSELIIGLTIVASACPAARAGNLHRRQHPRERDIVVGNVVGSNVLTSWPCWGWPRLLRQTGCQCRPRLCASTCRS